MNEFPRAVLNSMKQNGIDPTNAAGWTMPGKDGKPSKTGYVSIGQITRTTGQYPIVIGRVSAHETGHGFLGFAHGEGEDEGGALCT